MRYIDEDNERKLREEVPEFIEAVDKAAKDKVDHLLFMLDSFAGEPELLYNALWFAYSRGVSVLIIPKSQ